MGEKGQFLLSEEWPLMTTEVMKELENHHGNTTSYSCRQESH